MRLTNNFNLSEFNCRDAKNTPVPPELIPNVKKLAEQLQVIRDTIGLPLHINSAYRTPTHNKAIGGEKNSQHLQGKAADIAARDLTPKQLAKVIEKLIKDGKITVKGIGVYASFVHVDIRSGQAARW